MFVDHGKDDVGLSTVAQLVRSRCASVERNRKQQNAERVARD
ncbi:hypothetical protein [Variovorax sp. GT1P44]